MIFILMCSFQKPEPHQPSHQFPMPTGVPDPESEELELDHFTYERMAKSEDVSEKFREMLADIAEVCWADLIWEV